MTQHLKTQANLVKSNKEREKEGKKERKKERKNKKETNKNIVIKI